MARNQPANFLDRIEPVNREHVAWQEALTLFAEALGFESGSSAFNDPRFNSSIDMIQLWGERLVELRVAQTDEERHEALADAVDRVLKGR